jgi:hypothetical protein
MRYFAGVFPNAPNHCGQYGAIQMKSLAVTGYQQSPSPVNPAALQHEEAVLHHVNLNHRKSDAWLESHSVDGAIESRHVGQQRAHEEALIAQKRFWFHLAFAAGKERGCPLVG